jgi:bifunctional non-homologous end joining protein LigD
VRRTDKRTRIFTRRGFDWSNKYPAIVNALNVLRVKSVTIDGEAVYCGKDGLVEFDKRHSEAYNERVFLYAFDLLELDGVDLRDQALEDRKEQLEKLLRKAAWGLRYVEHLEGDVV